MDWYGSTPRFSLKNQTRVTEPENKSTQKAISEAFRRQRRSCLLADAAQTPFVQSLPSNTFVDGFEFDGATSQSWYVGLQWSDVFLKGNSAGMAVGQTTFVTAIDLDGNGSSSQEDIFARDGNYAWEWWYKFQVTDNISVTPALFYLSRPLGTVNQGNTFNQFGGLVKTTFKF
jgi:hypothetical protein